MLGSSNGSQPDTDSMCDVLSTFRKHQPKGERQLSIDDLLNTLNAIGLEVREADLSDFLLENGLANDKVVDIDRFIWRVFRAGHTRNGLKQNPANQYLGHKFRAVSIDYWTRQLIHEAEALKVIPFKRGEMGITHDDKGVVKGVMDDSQASSKRICKGYQIVRVDTEEYSKDAVVQAEKSGADYEVTFKVGMGRQSTVYDIAKKVIREKGANEICPRDGRKGAAYVDCVFGEDNVGLAVIMLSYTWGYTLGDIADALNEFCKDKSLNTKKIYTWMCCLCINQHRVIEARNRGETVPFEQFEADFSSRVLGVGKIVALMAPWRAPDYIKRVWCDFEMFKAMELRSRECKVSVTMPPAEEKDLFKCLCDTEGIDAMWKTLMDLKVEHADASVPADKERIFEMIKRSVGFHQVNVTLSSYLQEWMVQTCEDHLVENLSQTDLPPLEGIKLRVTIARMLIKIGHDNMLRRAQTYLEDGLEKAKLLSQIPPELEGMLKRELGTIHMSKGERDIAQAYIKDAFVAFARSGKISTPEGVSMLIHAGEMCRKHEIYDEAEKQFQRARNICLGMSFEEHVGSLQRARSLSSAQVELDTMQEEYKKYYARIFKGLGDTKRRMKNTEGVKYRLLEAIKDLQKSRQIVEILGTLETPFGAELLLSIGLAMQDCSGMEVPTEFKEAPFNDTPMNLFKEAIKIRELTHTLQSHAGGKLLCSLGKLQLELNRSSPEATSTFNGEMGIVCGDDGIVQEVIDNAPAHTKGISAGDKIVNVYANEYSMENLRSAEASGSDYEVTVRHRNLQEAEQTLKQAKKIFEKTDTLQTPIGRFNMTTLGHLFACQKRWGEALVAYEEAQMISLRTEGKVDAKIDSGIQACKEQGNMDRDALENMGNFLVPAGGLSVATWNVAASNTNPFEFWVSHNNMEYQSLMASYEQFLYDKGPEKDVPMHVVFSDGLFLELRGLMDAEGWDTDGIEEAWWKLYRKKKVLSEFMTDEALGKKRLVSMADLATSQVSIPGQANPAFRPTVVNHYGGDLLAMDEWWLRWRNFIFHETIVDTSAKGRVEKKRPCQMLKPLQRTKYKALSEAEENMSIQLQCLCLALYDSILVWIMGKIGNDGQWQKIKRSVTDITFKQKYSNTLKVLRSSARVDVICLQKVTPELKRFLEIELGVEYRMHAPSNYQHLLAFSMVLLRKTKFMDSFTDCTMECIDALESKNLNLEAGDFFAVQGTDTIDRPVMIASYHADSKGATTKPIVSAFDEVRKRKGNAYRVVFGIDAETQLSPGEGELGVDEFVSFLKERRYATAFKDPDMKNNCTTCKARTFLQPQLHKGRTSMERLTADTNPRDHIIFRSADFVLLSSVRDNTGNGTYLDGHNMPCLQNNFPSDHGLIQVCLQSKDGALILKDHDTDELVERATLLNVVTPKTGSGKTLFTDSGETKPIKLERGLTWDGACLSHGSGDATPRKRMPSSASTNEELILGSLNIIGECYNPLEFTPAPADLEMGGGGKRWEHLTQELSAKLGEYTIAQAREDVVAGGVPKTLEMFDAFVKDCGFTPDLNIAILAEKKDIDLELDNKWLPKDGRMNPLIFALSFVGTATLGDDDHLHINSCLKDPLAYRNQILTFYATTTLQTKESPKCIPSLLLWDLLCFNVVRTAPQAVVDLASFSYMCQPQDSEFLSPVSRVSMLQAIFRPLKILAEGRQGMPIIIGCQEMPLSEQEVDQSLPRGFTAMRMKAAGVDDSTMSGFVYRTTDVEHFEDVTETIRGDLKEFLVQNNIDAKVINTTLRKLCVGAFTLRCNSPVPKIAVVDFHCKSFGNQVVEEARFVNEALTLARKKCDCPAFGVGDMNIQAKWPKDTDIARMRQAVSKAKKGMMPSDVRGLVDKFGAELKVLGIKAAPAAGTLTTLKMRTRFQGQPNKEGELAAVQKDFVFVPDAYKVAWYAVGGCPELEIDSTNAELLQPSRLWPGDHFAVFCGVRMSECAEDGSSGLQPPVVIRADSTP